MASVAALSVIGPTSASAFSFCWAMAEAPSNSTPTAFGSRANCDVILNVVTHARKAAITMTATCVTRCEQIFLSSNLTRLPTASSSSCVA